ncbi:FAD binding domain-containing protein [Ramlibacter sp.]|uniref:FAD binding domain-containing protein n=1 Tax=Ramlibacter sp. TaxID=1917967 RepID=UPI003D0F1320
MKPAAFRYHAPRTLDQALALLAEHENAKVLAGGQSLMPMLNFRVVQPDHLVDINRVEGLAGVRGDGGAIRIGAMTRQCDLATTPLLRERAPLFGEALAHVGHPQTRNRGTIGGSLCHLDPAAELFTVAAALDARMEIVGPEGSRSVPVADWSLGYLTPALRDGELLAAIAFDPWPAGHGFAFDEYARRHGDFAIVCVAALLSLDAQGRIARAAIALGGCASAPVRLARAEKALIGEPMSAAAWEQAASEAREIDAMDDAYVRGAYRKHLAGVLVRRGLERAAARLR